PRPARSTMKTLPVLATVTPSPPAVPPPPPALVGAGRRALSWLAGRTGRRAHRTFRARIAVQSAFALVCLLLGVQFARWVRAAEAGVLPLPARPAGTEAFLPISGFMGFLDWIHQGALNTIHPAATVLFLLALVLALALRKSFCSWVCPVGFASDLLARFGRWSFGRNFRPWKWLDVPLRGLKYALLLFFVIAILAMSPGALRAFIESPYNRMAEVKMGLFFADLTRTGTMVMGALVLASVFIRGFWCRYLCPYGALLGFFSWLSPARITRTDACVDCKLCDKACASRLPVSTRDAVLSVECTGCMDCVAACPVPGALEMRVGRRAVTPVVYAAAVVGLFLAGYAGARATGSWNNTISDAEYVERMREIDSSLYAH
ncbi:MAG: 4Fe-4S binding protein, partial [Longimicrobiales bacterium]|nr:4Fe-4S binding protein [Longimicrobiales bacterium]